MTVEQVLGKLTAIMKNNTDNNKYSKKPKIAYTFSGLPGGLSLSVKRSANAWWMDQHKVSNLLAALRLNSSIREACLYAGITQKQYKYFYWQHPVIRDIREAFEVEMIILAKSNVYRALQNKSEKMTLWFLRNALPYEYSNKKKYQTPQSEAVTADTLEAERALSIKCYKEECPDIYKQYAEGRRRGFRFTQAPASNRNNKPRIIKNFKWPKNKK